MERYRVELNARRRKRGESAQAVHQDIKRLVALGFPGQSGDMYEVLSRDGFLNALSSHPSRPINPIFLKLSYIVLYFDYLSYKSYIMTV